MPTLVGFDIETAGELSEYALQPWRAPDKARILTWAVADERGAIPTLAPVTYSDCSKALIRLVDQWVSTGTHVCVWNALFEIAWLSRYVPEPLLTQVRWIDGMLLWRHLDNFPEYGEAQHKRRSFGLKAAVRAFLPEHAGYESGIEFSGDSALSGVEAWRGAVPSDRLDALLAYNAKDADYTRTLTMQFLDALAQSPQQATAAKIESRCLVPIALANVRGLPVDITALDALDARLQQHIDTLSDTLDASMVSQDVLASPVKLRELLYSDWELPVLKSGKTGASTDKTVLHELAQLDARAQAIRDYREAVGNRRKFVDTLRASAQYNGGHTHPLARVFGTYTGRITYTSSQGTGKGKRQTGWALHQMKRSPEFRRCIAAPQGCQIVEFDAAGQEFRLMAILSGDAHMLQLCQPGEDPHAFMGAQIAGMDYMEVKEGAKHDKRLKEVRQLGKVANLSCQYRTSAERLRVVARVQYGMSMDAALAQKVHRTYRATYSEVQRYWQRQIAFIERHLFVETLAGRRVWVTRQMLQHETWAAHSTAINYPIQGTGADQKYLAIASTRGLVASFGARLMFDLHDGIYFAVPDDAVNRFVVEMRAALLNLPYAQAWGVTLPAPLPFDCKVGPTWGDLREV